MAPVAAGGVKLAVRLSGRKARCGLGDAALLSDGCSGVCCCSFSDAGAPASDEQHSCGQLLSFLRLCLEAGEQEPAISSNMGFGMRLTLRVGMSQRGSPACCGLCQHSQILFI